MESIIAIDAMGGDHGPSVTVPAALQILKLYPQLHLILVGDREIIENRLRAWPEDIKLRVVVKHASEQIAMDESPSKALRTKKDSSMRVAINLVKEKIAKACVSAGNTGALMAMSHYVLKTMPGIDRPAIITSFPTMVEGKEVRVLDLGANVDAEAAHLYQFAVMGSALASAVDNIDSPRVALLNIGSEEIKGNEQVKAAGALLAENKYINYIGYVEGDDLFKGDVDIVVCDGFVGNVALKTIEGIVKLIYFYVKKAFTNNIVTKIAAIIVSPMLRKIAKQLDPGRRNGASFIGLQGIVIKSHGGANENAFANAIKEAIIEVEKNVPQRIRNDVARFLQEQI
jgi:phosphate acyltransferase